MVSERQSVLKGIEIPKDWNLEAVANLTLEHKQGYYTKDAYVDEGMYLIRITDLHNPKISFEDMPQVYIDKKTYEQFKVEENDFLFARSGAIGRYGIYKGEYPKAIFASYLIRFKFNAEKINNRYFGYFYESYLAQKQLGSITQGSSNININANNIKSLVVPLPAISEQKKIASILSSVDEAIEKTEAIIKQTEKVKKGLMQQLLSKGIRHNNFKDTEIGDIPCEWNLGTLKNYSEHITKGATPTTYGFDWVEEGVLFLRNECVKETGLSLKGSSFISEEAHIAMKRSIIKLGDILITITGNLGQCCIYDKGPQEANINQHIARIRIIDNTLNPQFVRYFLNSNFMRKKYDLIKTGLAYPQLSLKQIQDIVIPIPSIEEQQQIVSILSSFEKKIEVEQLSLIQLQNLKKGLMQSLFTGKVRVKVDEAEVTQV